MNFLGRCSVSLVKGLSTTELVVKLDSDDLQVQVALSALLARAMYSGALLMVSLIVLH